MATRPLKTHVTMDIGKAVKLWSSDSEEEEGNNPKDEKGNYLWRKAGKEPTPQCRTI
jgi:hypothetical protein